jgi:hypothetical protein
MVTFLHAVCQVCGHDECIVRQYLDNNTEVLSTHHCTMIEAGTVELFLNSVPFALMRAGAPQACQTGQHYLFVGRVSASS